MNSEPRRLNALAEVEQDKFLRKATKDALYGSIALAIHNVGISQTRDWLAQMRWYLRDFDKND